MNSFRRMGLRWRLALVAAVTLGLASVLGGFWMVRLLRGELVQDVYDVSPGPGSEPQAPMLYAVQCLSSQDDSMKGGRAFLKDLASYRELWPRLPGQVQ